MSELLHKLKYFSSFRENVSLECWSRCVSPKYAWQVQPLSVIQHSFLPVTAPLPQRLRLSAAVTFVPEGRKKSLNNDAK